MTVQEFLDRKPSREEVIDTLCKISNNELFGPPWKLFCWEELASYANLTESDFWEDADALTPEAYLYGQVAWRFKTDESQFTDNDKFDILSEKAKELYEKRLDNN